MRKPAPNEARKLVLTAIGDAPSDAGRIAMRLNSGLIIQGRKPGWSHDRVYGTLVQLERMGMVSRDRSASPHEWKRTTQEETPDGTP